VRDLLRDLMDSAAGRADYADVRHVTLRTEAIAMRNVELDELDAHDEEGFGVRVRLGGGWGFAAARGSDRAAAEEALARALALAQSQPGGLGQRRDAGRRLTREPAAHGNYVSPTATEPFAVSLDDKLALLADADSALRAEPRVTVAFAALRSTEGALYEQRLTECGAGIQATAVRGDDAQTRSYPASHSGHVAQAGWEHVLALDLAANAPRVAEQAAALLDGDGDHSRRDAARGDRQLPLGRRGRAGAVGPDRPRGHPAGLPVEPRERRGDRPRALRRLRARRGIRPPADRPDDQRQPRPRRRRVASRLVHRLRQGRARAGSAGLPRLRAGALPRRAGGSGVIDALETARRALERAGRDALVTVTDERSTVLRFARSRPTQATSVDDLTVEIAVLRDGHVGRAATNRIDGDALADCARAARLAAEAAAQAAGQGHYPGFPGAAPPRVHDGFDAETARLDPRSRRGLWIPPRSPSGRRRRRRSGASRPRSSPATTPS
jgi:predicted Zn-dependent protease